MAHTEPGRGVNGGGGEPDPHGGGVVDLAVLYAERECLGCAMRDPGYALVAVLGELTPEDYQVPRHAVVHRALMELAAAGEPTDVTNIMLHLGAGRALPTPDAGRTRTLLETAGGANYLHDLIADSGATASAGHYARIVSDAARRRDVAVIALRAARLAGSPSADAADVERELRAGLARLAWSNSARWPVPRPLAPRLPEFPAQALPGVLRRLVTAVAAATQTPPDLAAFAALAAVSVAVRGNWEIRMGGWVEQACLYMVALSDSGTRKSAALDAVAAPITELAWDNSDAELHAIETANYDVLEKRYRAAAERAAKAPRGAEYDDALREAEDLRVQLGDRTPPAEMQLLCDDTTPEELAVMMAAQGGPIAVLSDEGGLIGTLAGRYSKAGTAANIDVVLRAFNGTPVRVDRVGRPSVKIRRPILTLGFVIQSDVIDEAVKIPALTKRGLLPRMLFARPPTTVGTRDTDPPELPPEVAAEWARVIGKIYAAGRETARLGGTPGVILLDAGAKAALDAWRGPDGHEGRLHPETGDLADMVAWASKLPGALVRVAAMLALAERPGEAHPRIHEAEMRAALALAPYLIAHAREALGCGGGRTEHLEAVLAWVKKIVKDRPNKEKNSEGTTFNAPEDASELTFTLRDAWHGVRGQTWARRTEDVEEALARLADLGYVRTLPPPPPKRGRPPSSRYQVNPRLAHSPTRLWPR